MRILFMGTPDFALPSLSLLLKHSFTIPAVVTVPDKARGRGQKIGMSPVKRYALEHDLEVLQPEQLDDKEFLSRVKDIHPDLMVVVAFRILPHAVYSLAARGAFNLHASLLPKYRGAAPINWAIIRGERETGVSTFFLRDRVDTGSVILQARVNIGQDETAGELHDKLAEVGAEIVLQTVRLIETDRVQVREQDEGGATTAPRIFKSDCKIEWNREAAAIHNFVRGLSPAPTAWTTHDGKVVKVYRSALSTVKSDGPPGSVLEAQGNSLVVNVTGGSLAILELQVEGRNRMGAGEFLRGYSLRAGDVFGS